MIKPNWDIFKAKFSENPQDNFEWFCYLLFCKEFNKPLGVSGYKNQRHLEHNPIEKDKKIIGWQAKFYDTPLPQHKLEIIGMVEGAKKDYPSITKIIFYTNKNWSQGKKHNDPQAKLDIDNKAKELDIEIDWNHMENFFKSPFVSVDHDLISKNFFTLDKSIFDLIEEQQKHTENILSEIQTHINFGGKAIMIRRNDILEKLKDESSQVLVLSGVGGVGKTALVKNLYEDTKEKAPFYIFKATEFELRNINDFFKDFDFQDFIKAHNETAGKTIVIDSAEKLLDLKTSDPFKEFLTILVENKWKIIFTTRDNYLEDLNYQFFEIYNIVPVNINLKNLEQDDLDSISSTYSFKLPQDQKLLELLRNPFYLSEYLKFYKDDGEIDYAGFKETLWNKNIKKNKPARSECFLKIAIERANHGSFFIIPNCESSILDDELVRDGILGYEENNGYFITHDIYEEWALEKKISREYSQKTNNQSFFENIGQSLPVRRSFRNWVSEKLLLQDQEIGNFIEIIIADGQIQSFWKDEVLISILLSAYSDIFFKNLKDSLLENKQELLRKITFLLRVACKQVDEDFFKQLGIKRIDLLTLKYVLTKPKGKGWESIIKFVYKNLSDIGIENIYFILPIIHDWNSKFKTGETTKYSSLIALQYYQWILKEDVYFSRDDNVKDKLLQTILYGSNEIKDELREIFAEILKNKWKSHKDPYYDLSEAILTKLEGISVSQVLPEFVLQLADLFWSFTPKEDHFYTHSGIGVEQYFNMEDEHLNYFPASSYQTPVYWLLQSALKQTVDFILDFTNKTVESFAKSDFAKYEVKEIEVFIDGNKPTKQYICDRLWCTYRGTQVSPHVLESMHMALEKFFLENGKNTDSMTLENWLLYLLKKTNSSSISAVVTSIVLAYPEKTFNVAKILFQTREFFLYETHRLVLDQGHKSQLLMLKNNFGINSKNDVFENERLKACDDKHRKWSLEDLFLSYQCFRDEKTSEQEADERQKILWEILDNYYKKLPPEIKQTKSDEIWRLFLARMDRRKMKPTTKKTDQGIEIYWNPEIDPKLKKKSEDSQKEISEKTKYTALKMWSYYKTGNDEQHKQYEQYENNPKLALKEVKEIIQNLKLVKKPQRLQLEHTNDEDFYLLNYSIPGEVCSVLIRDYFEKLSKEENDFCAAVILEIASSSSSPNYKYQATDSTRSVISVLPVLLEKFPKEKSNIKKILLLNLFNHYSVDMAGTSFNAFSIMAIHKLWKTHFEDAQSILIGYLYLEPKYNELREKIRQEYYKKNRYDLQENGSMDKFLKEHGEYLHRVINNQTLMDDIGDIKTIDLYILKNAFQLIPLKTENNEHKVIVKKIIEAFVEKLTSHDSDDKIDYKVRHDFLEKFAYFVLSAPKEEIKEYIKPFLDKFNSSEAIADLFKEFISAEDYLNSYENFWEVWNLFKEKIVEVCKEGDGHWYVDKIIKSYLFAQNPWKESATEWHTLKDNNKRFFKEISEKIGHCSSTLYAISKLLNDIGSHYLDDGILWISDMLNKNKDLLTSKFEVNTIYYIENLARKYIYKYRTKIRKTKKLKEDVLVILDFLIAKGSVVGYILRESVV
ncbi:MAG: AVAST type 4 anti-phage nuclease Avs4 [Candidatus Levybacteria bacterium]|nr:AVAST type 4 anti-phage nuclease Avs4 [Candidatus Levybacteria bacterium]